MKKNSRNALPIFLCLIMAFALAVPAMAGSYDPMNGALDEKNISESIKLEHGTMYLEENSAYRMAYTTHNDGNITYSISYSDSPMVAHYGSYVPDGSARTNAAIGIPREDIASVLPNLEPEKTTDFSQRAQTGAGTVLTHADALAFAARYASGYKTPTSSSKLLGSYSGGGKVVKVYEDINGRVIDENILWYHAGDALSDIVAIMRGIDLAGAVSAISTAWNTNSERVAQESGAVTYFKVDNTRTKTARIDGRAYYSAGWDVYYVCSGDKSASVEQTENFMNSDYNRSVAFFAQKAIQMYLFGD